MDRAEAEAIYDSGRERCVEVILELAGAVERLGDQCERLEDRIRGLEEQVRRDSRTSSKPPSSDPPRTRQQRRAEARAKAKELLAGDREKRKAGGQPGHRGAGRELAPEDHVDEIVEHFPGACRGCGREFSEDERGPVGRFGRDQVCELPPISVLLVEHRSRRLRCPECRAETIAELPAGISASAFGPRLRAAIVTLTARNRISRRGASELAGELFGARVSTGSVDAICQHASDALAGPYDQLREWVLDRNALHVDETGWRTAGDSRALWTASTADASLFQIAQHCNREQFDQLIGPFAGILVSDRWNGYEHLDPTRRQVWSRRPVPVRSSFPWRSQASEDSRSPGLSWLPRSRLAWKRATGSLLRASAALAPARRTRSVARLRLFEARAGAYATRGRGWGGETSTPSRSRQAA